MKISQFFTVQAYLVLLCFTLLYFTDNVFFLQIEGNTLYQQKDYDLLHCETHFIAVVRNGHCNVSEVCLHLTV